MDAAACIGCGACVAACKNASAMLFVSAKVSHLALLPQGKAEAERRVLNMVRTMDESGFGNCTVTGSCEAVCPKEISLDFIAKMNREYGKAILKNRSERKSGDEPSLRLTSSRLIEPYNHRSRLNGMTSKFRVIPSCKTLREISRPFAGASNRMVILMPSSPRIVAGLA